MKLCAVERKDAIFPRQVCSWKKHILGSCVSSLVNLEINKSGKNARAPRALWRLRMLLLDMRGKLVAQVELLRTVRHRTHALLGHMHRTNWVPAIKTSQRYFRCRGRIAWRERETARKASYRRAVKLYSSSYSNAVLYSLNHLNKFVNVFCGSNAWSAKSIE